MNKNAKNNLVIVTLLFLTILLYLFFASAWSDDGTNPANVNGCNTLNTTNGVYTLISDVNSTGTCFNITATNITLDCAGYTINYSYAGTVGYGIYSDKNFTTVKNCVIKEGKSTGSDKYGIYLRASNNGTINNNTIKTTGTNSYGIQLSRLGTPGSNGNTISNNNITTLSGHGIYLNNQNMNNNISNNIINTVGTSSYGIYLFSSSNSNTILYNNITTLECRAIFLSTSSNFNTIDHNIITTDYDNGYGIYLFSSSNSNTISNNTINTSGTDNAHGIILSSSLNNNILKNTINTLGIYGMGIFLSSSSSNNILNNTIFTSGSGGHGIYFQTESYNNTISGMNIQVNSSDSHVVYLIGIGAHNFTISDSVLNSSLQEFYIDSSITGGIWNFTNVTKSNGNPITINWTTGANGTLNTMWYLDVNVTDSSSSALENVNVTGKDVNSNFMFSELTLATGFITTKTLQEYKNENNTLITYYTSHTITANLTGYIFNTTTLNLSSSLNTHLNIKLDLLDTTYPSISITYPTMYFNTTNNNLNINYTRSDTNLGSCWYSNDSMTINTTLVSCTNITTITWVDGLHNVTIWVNDTAGNTNSSLVIFRIDTTPPITTASATPYTFNTWTNSNVEVLLDTIDLGIGFDNLAYPLSCTDTTNTCTPNVYDIDLTISTENVSYVRYYSNDTLNNKETTKSQTIKIDKTNPSSKIAYPTSGLILNSLSVPLNFSVSDSYSGISNCSYSLNGGTTNISLPSCTNTTLSVSEGSVTINLYVNDTVNNKNNSASVTFTTDITYPIINIVTPINNTNSSNNQLNINYTRSDTNLGNCWYTRNYGLTNTTLTSCTNITGVTWNEGLNNITIYVNDTAGNTNSSNVRFVIDTVFPLISIISPLNNSNFSDNTLDIKYTFTELNPSICWYSNDTMTFNTTLSCGNNITSTIWSEGIHNVTIWINDSVNHVNLSSVTFMIDTVNPLISYGTGTSVNSSNLSKNFIYVNTTWTETNLANITFNLYFNNGTIKNSTIYTTPIYLINWTNLIDGVYIYNVSIRDTLNHYNETENRRITLDTTYPLISYGTNSEIDGNNVSRANIYLNVSVTETNEKNITFLLYNLTSPVNSTTYTTSIREINWTSIPNTDYTYNVTICDILNQCNTTISRTIRLDTTSPNATLITPLNNTFNSTTTQNFTVNLTDNLGIKNATLHIYNQSGEENSTTTNFISNTVTYTLGVVVTLLEGLKTWWYDVWDWAGNHFTTGNYTVNIDSTFPQIKIITPTNFTNTTNTQLNVNFTRSDTNLASCWYTANEGTTNTTLASCTNITTVTWSEGINNVIIFANDSANNVNSTSITFRLDTTNPLVNIINPADTSSWSTNTIYLNYTVSDSGVGLSSCWYRNNTNENISISCGTNTTLSQPIDGTYTVSVCANDSLNNVFCHSHTWTISATAPAVTLIHPTDGITPEWFSDGTNIYFNYTSVDDNGIDTCQLWGNWTGTWHLNQSKVHSGDLSVDASEGFFTGNMPEGLITWNIKCNDTNNDLGEATSNFTFYIDKTYPLIYYESDTSDDNTNTTSTSIYVNVSITELYKNTITFLLYNSTGQINKTSFTDGRTNLTWFSLLDNIYYYNVTINDSAGNINSTATRLIRLDDTKPVITIDEPKSQNYANNNSMSLNYTVTDNLVGGLTCRYNIFNSSGSLITSIGYSTCQNTTFALPGGDIEYTLTLFARDSLLNTQSNSVTFGIRTIAPVIVLYPSNDTYSNRLTNHYFNFTVSTNSDSISTCELWGDFNGSFSKNQTKTSVTYDGITKNSFNSLNLTERIFIWNVWCNDSLNNNGWALNNNTFITDITHPISNITTANATSVYGLAITINFNITDTNLNSCYFTLRDSSGNLHNYAENTSLTCSDTSRAISTLVYGTYTIKIYGEDKANNLNSSIITFTTQAPASPPTSGGGGTPSTQKPKIPVIAIQDINSSTKYTDLQLSIIYAEINSFVSKKLRGETLAVIDYSEEANLNQLDLQVIIKDIYEKYSIQISLADMNKFYQNYKLQNFLQFYATESEIDSYNLFPSVRGLTTLLELTPSSISKPIYALTNPGENYTAIFKIASNKPIAECEVLSNNADVISCESINSIIIIKYYINNTNFFNKMFSGLVNVRTEAPQDQLEAKRIPINFQFFNLSYVYSGIPILVLYPIIIILILLVVILIFRKLSARRKRKIVEAFKIS